MGSRRRLVALLIMVQPGGFATLVMVICAVSLGVAGLGLAGRVSAGRLVRVVTLDMHGFLECLEPDLSGPGGWPAPTRHHSGGLIRRLPVPLWRVVAHHSAAPK